MTKSTETLHVWKFDDCEFVAGTDLAEAQQWYYELTGVRVEEIDEVQDLDTPDVWSDETGTSKMTWRQAIADMLNSGEAMPMIIGFDGYYA